MLEGALVLLATVLMITVVLDLGQVLMFMQYLSERSRAGARYAAVHTQNADAVRNYVVYNTPFAPQGLDAPPGFMGLTRDQVQVTYTPILNPTQIRVTISNFPLRFYTPFLAGVYTPRPFSTVVPVESLGATQ